jgi:hypothetical protein
MSIVNDPSADFTERPPAPKEYVDTADLIEAVTGKRPEYCYDANAGEWVLSSSPDTGRWPRPCGYACIPAHGEDATSMLLSIEKREDDGSGGVWLHIEGDFGKAPVRSTRDDALLWAKLLKKAAKEVSR